VSPQPVKKSNMATLFSGTSQPTFGKGLAARRQQQILDSREFL
jgi:hypothetical protein